LNRRFERKYPGDASGSANVVPLFSFEAPDEGVSRHDLDSIDTDLATDCRQMNISAGPLLCSPVSPKPATRAPRQQSKPTVEPIRLRFGA
jgi:hypothetical protein